MQRLERCLIVTAPKAPPCSAHVPVREVVDEVCNCAAGERRVVRLHPRGHALDGRREPRADPAVQVGQLGLRAGLRQVRVLHVERVRVPQREHELAHALADGVDREAVSVPRLLRGEVVPAEGVSPMALDHVPRDDHVPAGLAHLLALGIEDQPEAEHRAVGGAPVQQHRHREQGVEPPARLVERLADVVGGEVVGELLDVLERRVPLGERHRARVPPRVDHLRHAPHLAAALLAGEDDLVDEWLVEVRRDLPAPRLELGA